MEASEREFLLARFDSSRKKLLDSVDGLTPEQWDFRPAPERWSIADCVEHVVLVENRVLGSIHKNLDRPPEPEKQEQARPKDDFLREGRMDRAQRFNAPEAVHPKRHWPETAQLLAAFDQTRARTAEFASETQADLRSHFFPHPVFGELDCYQWLMLMGLHSIRHVQQIDEIKADAAFPKQEGT